VVEAEEKANRAGRRAARVGQRTEGCNESLSTRGEGKMSLRVSPRKGKTGLQWDNHVVIDNGGGDPRWANITGLGKEGHHSKDACQKRGDSIVSWWERKAEKECWGRIRKTLERGKSLQVMVELGGELPTG